MAKRREVRSVALEFEDAEALREWLLPRGSQGLFYEDYCLRIEANHEGRKQLPETVTITLAFEDGGKSGRAIFTCYDVVATGVTAYEGTSFDDSPKGRYIDNGVVVPRIPGVLAIAIPDFGFEIKCRLITVSTPYKQSFPAAHYLTNVVEATFQRAPTPEEWINYFRSKGHEVVWRTFGGDASQLSALPGPEFTRLLQFVSKFASTDGGISVETVRRGRRFCVSVSNYHFPFAQERPGDNDELLRLAHAFLADARPARIVCGSYKFTPQQWRLYLCVGTLPE